jgi:hypothetical protein
MCKVWHLGGSHPNRSSRPACCAEDLVKASAHRARCDLFCEVPVAKNHSLRF